MIFENHQDCAGSAAVGGLHLQLSFFDLAMDDWCLNPALMGLGIVGMRCDLRGQRLGFKSFRKWRQVPFSVNLGEGPTKSIRNHL